MSTSTLVKSWKSALLAVSVSMAFLVLMVDSNTIECHKCKDDCSTLSSTTCQEDQVCFTKVKDNKPISKDCKSWSQEMKCDNMTEEQHCYCDTANCNNAMHGIVEVAVPPEAPTFAEAPAGNSSDDSSAGVGEAQETGDSKASGVNDATTTAAPPPSEGGGAGELIGSLTAVCVSILFAIVGSGMTLAGQFAF